MGQNYLNIRQYNNKMSNYIILFSSLFGSVYLMAKSLELINSSFLENKKIPRELIIINGLTFAASSYIFIAFIFRR
jgi:hypothetical protein